METGDTAAGSPKGRAYLSKLKRPSSFSKPQLALFVLAFAVIGYLLVKALAAAPLIASLESESMTPNIPAATGSSSFTTTVTQNMTLSTPYIWAFNPGVGTTKGYFWADGKLLATVGGPGPYAFRLNPGVLTSGTHTLGHAWDTDTGIHQSPTSAYPVTVSNTSSKGFITTLSQNLAVNTPYLWAFDPGVDTKTGYFYHGNILHQVNGPGPYVWMMPPGTLANGSTKLGHAWDTTTGVHQAPSSAYNVTVNNSSTTSSGGSASTITDSTASAGKAEKFSAGVSISGSVSLPSAGSSLNVVAHGEQCSTGGWPTMTVSLDGTQVLSTSVSSSSWSNYTVTKSMTAGAHTLTIANASSGTCVPNLYADVTNFFGTVSPPTVSLTANPASINTGASSTLSWTSTNANSCSGTGFSTNNAPSGSVTVTPTASTTYTVNCTGDGGSVSQTATITVTAPNPGGSFTTSLTSGMTITPPYTWTFNPGAASVKGYFYADGNVLGTATPNASGTYTYTLQSGTLTAGAHTLGHAWDLADGSHHSPSSAYPVTIAGTTPPPPPPTPTGTIYFDGRAKNMTSLSSTGIIENNNIVQSQSPAGFWDCLCFTNNSITLQSDPTFGKIYKYYEGPGDRGPYNSGYSHNTASGEVSKRHPGNALGTTDYYSFAVKVPSPGWNNPDWSDFVSFGYQTASWDANAIAAQVNNGVATYVYYGNAGYVNCPTTTCRGTANHDYNWILPVTYNQWEEFTVAFKWSTNMTGFIKVWARPIGGTWKQYVDLENTDTLLYGTTAYGTFAQNYTGTFLDKQDLYYGYWNSATTSFPYETIYHSGLVRASDFNTAASTLP